MYSSLQPILKPPSLQCECPEVDNIDKFHDLIRDFLQKRGEQTESQAKRNVASKLTRRSLKLADTARKSSKLSGPISRPNKRQRRECAAKLSDMTRAQATLLSALWEKYFHELCGNKTSTKELLIRFKTADLHGARLTLVASTTRPLLVGRSFIAVGETEASWRLWTSDHKLQLLIPKEGSTFHLHWNTQTFVISGNHRKASSP